MKFKAWYIVATIIAVLLISSLICSLIAINTYFNTTSVNELVDEGDFAVVETNVYDITQETSINYPNYKPGDRIILVGEISRINVNNDRNTVMRLSDFDSSPSAKTIELVFWGTEVSDEYNIGDSIAIRLTIVRNETGAEVIEEYQGEGIPTSKIIYNHSLIWFLMFVISAIILFIRRLLQHFQTLR